ncbi:MAG: hypothetical protein A2271_02235 [Candidatus Moranbacteria bacterium RIFOXYA12_FULL_35_19]|nr:MAG: hypothetical protein UR78_C0009G0009 [Candidatus Moranbacteria bacterium GW2011_GWF2_35_39]OGI32777.1 MAG: hypothetical protein A2489_02590 [Candidatus Moranbacteria bacterium RIFOXYC12_FULL_36_13]OGI36848.1 MAG: hypothetical protein A2271_02235 [Candidatus Moranbacteria bacterium RIFOXYA12_FULL_35_19]
MDAGLSIFLKVFYYTWWIILPKMLWYIFSVIWVDFTLAFSDNSWRADQNWIVLEVIPPREIEKGPKMMENIFTGISAVIVSYNTFDQFLKGAWEQDRFSFEFFGEAGKMHFYIRTHKKHRNMVEAQVYAQYPDAEILQVPDYTQNFPKIVPNKKWDLWGTDFEFVAKDPIPIKTYDKFEETITGEMNDPLSSMAEVISTLGPGQFVWLQYVLEPIKEGEGMEEYKKVLKKLKGEKILEPMGLAGHLVDVAKNIFGGIFGPVEFAKEKKEELAPLEFRLSPIEKEVLKATEENLGKNLFKTKMRYIYLAKRENWDNVYKGAVIGAIKQFNDINYNSVKPEDVSKTYGKIFFTKPRADFRKRKIYGRYKSRNMDGVKIVFSTKELATLFHFPDMGVKSPSITRTAGKLGSAPMNLPIE